MSLPSPNLDDRPFQAIVDDVKRQIGRRCPEWTDHNVSDPGVTLIELFAWMTEMMLFRMNQVPEKNYIKFLEMIGVSLEPPAPAQTDLQFRLSRPIEDAEGEEAFERTLRARETVAATVRTESDQAVEFLTDADLQMRRPRLAHILAVPAADLGVPGDESTAPGARNYNDWRVKNPRAANPPEDESEPQAGFPLFGPVPRDGDTVYFGFEANVSGNLVQLDVNAVPWAATGLREDYPSQRWEVWNGGETRWEPLEVVLDTSHGFNRQHGGNENGIPVGLIELLLPYALTARQIGGQTAYWARCRYTLDLPAKDPGNLRPAPYQKPPEIRAVAARVVGGAAPASNCVSVPFKDLGQSDGTPGQVFAIGHAPILPRRIGETVLIGPQGLPPSEMEEWEEVHDFSQSGPNDRHFVCDSFSGEIYFGPLIEEPDGSPPKQHGKVPDSGLTISFSAYRHGGGTNGNVAGGQVSILKSSIPYIAEVVNPKRAYGGRQQETLDRAKLRGQTILRQRDRAVTSEDYEFLARQASSAVGRARCVQPRPMHQSGDDGERIAPGVVRVLLVPALGAAVNAPRPAELRIPPRVRQDVYDYLDKRRLLTAVLEVGEPDYVYVSTDITLVVDPKADADQVVRAVREKLETYIHPLRGGPHGDGWPFRRALTLSDIYAQVQAARGVAFLTNARIFMSRVVDLEQGILTSEDPVSNAEGVRIGDNSLLCSREHRIRAIPMWAVGMESEEGA